MYYNFNGDPLALENDKRNRNNLLQRLELKTYTWKGIPVELHTKKVTSTHFLEIPPLVRLIGPSRERSAIPPIAQTPLVEEALIHMHFGAM